MFISLTYLGSHYVFFWVCVCMFLCVCAHMCVCTCMCVHIYMCMCTHIHITCVSRRQLLCDVHLSCHLQSGFQVLRHLEPELSCYSGLYFYIFVANKYVCHLTLIPLQWLVHQTVFNFVFSKAYNTILSWEKLFKQET